MTGGRERGVEGQREGRFEIGVRTYGGGRKIMNSISSLRRLSKNKIQQP